MAYLSAAVTRARGAERVQQNLSRQIVGRQLLHYHQLPSTNDEARCLAAAGVAEGTVVVAETQTAGRGRRGRQWRDIPGKSLLFSIILRPAASSRLLPPLSLGIGAATAQALRDTCRLDVVTKWPNDLLIGKRKVGGILLEGNKGLVVVGVGLNVNGEVDELQNQVPQPLTTMEEQCGHSLPREEVLLAVLEKIDRMYRQFRQGELDAIRAAYEQLDCTIGQQVTIVTDAEQIAGQALSLAPTGALVIQTACGQRQITAGDVHFSTC